MKSKLLDVARFQEFLSELLLFWLISLNIVQLIQTWSLYTWLADKSRDIAKSKIFRWFFGPNPKNTRDCTKYVFHSKAYVLRTSKISILLKSDIWIGSWLICTILVVKMTNFDFTSQTWSCDISNWSLKLREHFAIIFH